MGGLLEFKYSKELYPKTLTVADLNDTSLESGIYFVANTSNVANSPEDSTRYLLVQFNAMKLSNADNIGQIAFLWSIGPSFIGVKSRSFFNNTWGSWI